MMGHLDSFSASGGGNLNKNFAKNTNARGLPGGGMLKLRFDWYIILAKSLSDFNGSNFHRCIWAFPDHKSMSSSHLHIN